MTAIVQLQLREQQCGREKNTTYAARNHVRLQLSIVSALVSRHIIVVVNIVVLVAANVIHFRPGVARKIRWAACVFFAVVLIGT